ncbi:hypothetical protein XENOCAPTIV_018544 [Xenoophorus captivus]|uniref:Uncharacterized protein n=1 Tax=Xenoophorus captivus TaxID=1517983 RepID=A0ABV0R5U3_9TELE
MVLKMFESLYHINILFFNLFHRTESRQTETGMTRGGIHEANVTRLGLLPGTTMLRTKASIHCSMVFLQDYPVLILIHRPINLTSFPDPPEDKHPHPMMVSPPTFTMGLVCSD